MRTAARITGVWGLALLGWGAGCAAPEAPLPLGSKVSPAEPDADPLIPLPELEPAPAAPTLSFPFLEGEREGASVSIGNTTHGRLANARELVERDWIGILPKQRERDLRYGTEGLVGVLEHAGKALYDQTRTRLWVGNLGRREGGDITWSVSHNAGRDADVAFCYRDPNGNAVDPPDLVPLGRSGTSKDGKLSLDVKRTWIVVRAMLEYEAASLQYVFVAEALKQKLLLYAKATREPAAIIERANAVLRQPWGAAAHDDHLHVRLYCSREDAAGGCIDTGFVHPFAKLETEARGAARDRALGLLSDVRGDLRRRALLRLGLVGDPADAAEGAERLFDPDPAVRAAAASLVGTLGTDKDVSALVTAFHRETDAAALAAILDAVGALGGADAGPLLRDLILAAEAGPFAEPIGPSAMSPSARFGEPRTPLRLLSPPAAGADQRFDRAAMRLLAVRASARADRLEPVAPLAELLGHADEALAVEAADSLAFITNHRPRTAGKPGAEPASAAERLAAARAELTPLLSALEKAPREVWVVRGFGARGYKVPALDKRGAWELLRAVDGEAHLSYNARKALARMLGESSECVGWHPGEACRYFKRTLDERRGDLALGRPTAAQQLACITPAD